MPETPEQQARANIDRMLKDSGWAVQDYKAFDPSAFPGTALDQSVVSDYPRPLTLMSTGSGKTVTCCTSG